MIRNKQFREDLFYNRRSFIKGSATLVLRSRCLAEHGGIDNQRPRQQHPT